MLAALSCTQNLSDFEEEYIISVIAGGTPYPFNNILESSDIDLYRRSKYYDLAEQALGMSLRAKYNKTFERFGNFSLNCNSKEFRILASSKEESIATALNVMKGLFPSASSDSFPADMMNYTYPPYINSTVNDGIDTNIPFPRGQEFYKIERESADIDFLFIPKVSLACPKMVAIIDKYLGINNKYRKAALGRLGRRLRHLNISPHITFGHIDLSVRSVADIYEALKAYYLNTGAIWNELSIEVFQAFESYYNLEVFLKEAAVEEIRKMRTHHISELIINEFKKYIAAAKKGGSMQQKIMVLSGENLHIFAFLAMFGEITRDCLTNLILRSRR